MATQAEKSNRFWELHREAGVFALPNPWDPGSAKMLEGMGFVALATTSSGFAQTLGRMDGEVTFEEKLEHCRALVDATDIPITVDFENGFAHPPEDVAVNVRRLAETGVAGASIEDFTGDSDHPIYTMDLAVERVRAAVEAAASLPFPFMITARSEHLLHVGPEVDQAIERVVAYERAGAGAVYAPGLKTLADIEALTAEVTVPVNVLGPFLSAHTLEEIGNAGAKRVSLGGALARRIAAATIEAGRSFLDGRLDWVREAAPAGAVKALFESGA